MLTDNLTMPSDSMLLSICGDSSQESVYKYVGMNDADVENMIVAKLPENMTLENVKLYMALHRQMHAIINMASNMGEATAKGSSKLAYMLDFIEQNPFEKMTADWLLVGSIAVELKEAEARGDFNTHLHDLTSIDSHSRDERIDILLRYYLQEGEMGKYFDMQGEAAAAGILAALI
jgi:spore coat protein CotH